MISDVFDAVCSRSTPQSPNFSRVEPLNLTEVWLQSFYITLYIFNFSSGSNEAETVTELFLMSSFCSSNRTCPVLLTSLSFFSDQLRKLF